LAEGVTHVLQIAAGDFVSFSKKNRQELLSLKKSQ